MKIRKISPEEFRTSAWAGGITQEIMIYPPDAQYSERSFLYRISTAVVEAEESKFTPLPSYNRFIAALNGPLSLVIDEAEFELKPFEVLEFDGGANTSSRSQANLRDLNLMIRKGYKGSMIITDKAPVSGSDRTQIAILIVTGDQGEFSEILEVQVKPQGIPWDNFGALENIRFAVITIEEEEAVQV